MSRSTTFSRFSSPARSLNKSFLHLGHECEMPPTDNPIARLFPGRSTWAFVRRELVKSLLVHEKIGKTVTIHLRSHGSIVAERQRQLLLHQTTLHPQSVARLSWEVLMILIFLSQLVLVPMDVAYYSLTRTMPYFSSGGFVALRMCLDLACCLDIGVQFVTGYYDEEKKEVVLRHHDIVTHYLKTGFLLDLITSVPTHWDIFFTDLSVSSPLALQILQGVSMLKYLKALTSIRYLKRLSNILGISFYKRQLFLVGMSIVLFWHITSHSLVFGYVVGSDTDNIHIYRNYTTPTKVLARCLYEGSLIIYTASYGIRPPDSDFEFVAQSVFWFVSKFVQICFLARMIEYLKASQSPRLKYNQMVKQLVEFMRHKQLPHFTQARLLSYYEFHYQQNYFKEDEIYATMSGSLRQEVAFQTCRRLVEDVDFFKGLPLNLLMRIVTCLKSEFYLTNDVIIKAGLKGDCMYFISSGTVAVYTMSGKEVYHLEDGSHFGEVALVAKDSLRIASVVAVETCELFRLDSKDFIKAIYPYPDLLDKVQKIAEHRTEMTKMVEECERFDITMDTSTLLTNDPALQ